MLRGIFLNGLKCKQSLREHIQIPSGAFVAGNSFDA